MIKKKKNKPKLRRKWLIKPFSRVKKSGKMYKREEMRCKEREAEEEIN